MTAANPLETADDALGRMVEQLTISHHRRRLQHVGWSAAIDPPAGGWAAAGSPPRPGNAVEVLIDGADALQAMAVSVADARSHVHVTGWHISPEFGAWGRCAKALQDTGGPSCTA